MKSIAGILGNAVLSDSVSAITGSLDSSSNRQALIIGNSNYGDSPLKNPVNDAKSLAKALNACGFSLQLLLDGSQREMSDAIINYGFRLAKDKAVGVFYYAGHGAQLAWRNYLIPVDSIIDHLDDLPKRCVELNSLLSALTKAANPMNIIILDACRDNPFGSRLPPEQKGLSQFDAPPGSLLSYATAPGNTASDGVGANGLFTENLLREMLVAGAKLEDVFKRVRLNVRLKSNGQQIPWESTSLEDDFYFVPQTESGKATQEERNRRFEEEQSDWDRARLSSAPSALELYLHKYPSGMYSQLAQAQLDNMLARQGEKKIVVSSATDNPFSKGSATGVGSYSIGDYFSFVKKNIFTEIVEEKYIETVTEVLDDRTIFDNKKRIVDLLGNEIKSPSNRFLSQAQFFPSEYTIGQKWATRFGWLRSDGVASEMEVGFKVVGRQMLVISAGRFNAFVVEGMGYVIGGGSFQYRYLIDPDKCSRPLVFEIKNKNRRGGWGDEVSRTELVDYYQKSKAANKS